MMLEAKDYGQDSEEINQVVRALLVTTDGQVCIGKRGPGYEAGKWCLVGGRVEKDGALVEELLREIVEETGVAIQDLTDEILPTFVVSRVRHKHEAAWHNNYFLVEIYDEAISGVLFGFNRVEFSEVRFVAEEDIKGLRFAFGDGKVIRGFFKEVGN